MDPVNWSDISNGALGRRIDANSKHENVWILTGGEASGSSAIAKFNAEKKTWEKDITQPRDAKNQYNSIGVDPQGNPAFVDTNSRIWWKKAGKWVKIDGCASRVAFGGDGSLFKTDCSNYVKKYENSEKWTDLG